MTKSPTSAIYACRLLTKEEFGQSRVGHTQWSYAKRWLEELDNSGVKHRQPLVSPLKREAGRAVVFWEN